MESSATDIVAPADWQKLMRRTGQTDQKTLPMIACGFQQAIAGLSRKSTIRL
jgi:hypothetical protein